MQPWRQSPSLFVKPNVLPWLHFTQIEGLLPLQLSSSCSSHTTSSYHQAGTWPCSFRPSQITPIISSQRVFSQSNSCDSMKSFGLIWFQKFLTSLLSLRLSTFPYCHRSWAPVLLKWIQHGLASCRLLLPLFLCWKLWGRGKVWEDKSKVSQTGHSGRAVCWEQSLSQNKGPWAKLSGSFLTVLLHISWRILKESFKLNRVFASKSTTKVAWFSEVLKAYSFC